MDVARSKNREKILNGYNCECQNGSWSPESNTILSNFLVKLVKLRTLMVSPQTFQIMKQDYTEGSGFVFLLKVLPQ
jgi:hypothetical protein